MKQIERFVIDVENNGKWNDTRELEQALKKAWNAKDVRILSVTYKPCYACGQADAKYRRKYKQFLCEKCYCDYELINWIVGGEDNVV